MSKNGKKTAALINKGQSRAIQKIGFPKNGGAITTKYVIKNAPGKNTGCISNVET